MRTIQRIYRPEFVHDVAEVPSTLVAKPLTKVEKIFRYGFVRKSLILIALTMVWQIYAEILNAPLLFPTFVDTCRAFYKHMANGVLIERAWGSIRVLLIGYLAGMAMAAVLTAFAITTRIGNDILETLTSMFNPLPAIALLPLALIWFGLGTGSIVFVLIHSVVWPVALNTHAGFMGVSSTVRMVGRNYGLRGLRFVGSILVPAASSSILTGAKIGWAFAWRTLIAAELVFGVSSGSGGLGWFIYENKNELEIPSVFAGLLAVIAIGLLVENAVFRVIERKTIRRWGMHF